MTGGSRRTLKLTIAYDGTGFHGWQSQAGQRTVQGSVLDALRRICPDVEDLPGASRTDSGVHALGQCASCRTDSAIPLERIRPALNGSLPREIRIRSVEEAAPDFHARHSARGKLYRYWVDRADDSSPFTSRYALCVTKPLDVDAMRRAARAF
ncbi:MAG TPA: tRNA pseudouridine(38-40) synthase TruA, partial [Candidatus Eisenbacteria bacterium]|nr:tRNA pseudouridine(38-40) synthase TruA [Candidatus Eisenbacteria bacterium]